MPISLPAPLMSTPLATLRVAGSMVTIHLPSTRPRIDPACAEVATVIEAATAPIMTSVARFRGMKVSPRSRDGRGNHSPLADTAKSYEELFAELQEDAREVAGSGSRLRDGTQVLLFSIHLLIESGMIHGHAKLVSTASHAPFMAPAKSPSTPRKRTLTITPMIIQRMNQQPETMKTRRIVDLPPVNRRRRGRFRLVESCDS